MVTKKFNFFQLRSKLQFLKRDENGIIELSTKYHPYCYKIAWNLLANREDAEECLNDTWFSVWSQIPPTHPPVLAHFCGRITRNLVSTV